MVPQDIVSSGDLREVVTSRSLDSRNRSSKSSLLWGGIFVSPRLHQPAQARSVLQPEPGVDFNFLPSFFLLRASLS